VSTPGPRPHDTYESDAIFDATGVLAIDPLHSGQG